MKAEMKVRWNQINVDHSKFKAVTSHKLAKNWTS